MPVTAAPTVPRWEVTALECGTQPMPFLSSLARRLLVLFDQVKDHHCSNSGQDPPELRWCLVVQNRTIESPVLLFCFFAAQPSPFPPTPLRFPPHSFRQGAVVRYIHLIRNQSHSHGYRHARVSRPWLPGLYHVQRTPPLLNGTCPLQPSFLFSYMALT